MDDHKLFELIEEAIMQGSVDEDMIILYAKLRDLSFADISELELLLRSCKCNATEPVDECPEVGSMSLNFDTVVHKCLGRKKKCAHLVSTGAFDRLFERWHKMVKDHFGGWENKDMFVSGEVYDHQHEALEYNLLLKKVTLRIGDETREVPKIWASVDPEAFSEVKGKSIPRGTEVSLVGRVEWDDHIHFYHLTDVTDLKVSGA